ncbi:hypothetical protein EMIHUDRAFT_219272 [Emiliania huxleyi CCMP1516]|uniref:Glycosyltransferase 61 catalytic domain-containing protein n=2 Tax=Emiliania huxleyi TaxID=2903 RepID=A0A0D3I555_EMIH1|nr:hypothetical protein EMIHUDRAFT_219272 [Emiliania huxleyi CCMP1516]EOD06390.1 hypothetical protein EMIHUDRAFT_219272 [Emiliania huxleyi CCMP1516]|eukprot:XP_005758819.1 hypothetical protein EMIHUDRAFT_219272 [Emiliania huxleyi CCMP1516]
MRYPLPFPCVPDRPSKILLVQAPYTLQSPRLLARVSLTPMRLHAASTEGDDAYPSVIYYSRRAPENGNGRLFNSNHDEMLPRLISSRMKHFNRGERFVFFNGRQTGEYPRPGYPMTAAQQLALFRTANLFIGPHGTAFANVLWMRPARGSEGCETHHQRLPHVIEFVCGAGSAAVREGCPYVRSYYYMLGGAAWVNWHHVLYTPRATAGVVKVDFGEVKNALDAILKHLPPTNLPPHWSTIEGVTGPPLVSEAAVWLRRTGGGQNESRQVDEDDDIPKNITGWTGWRQFMMLETLPN